MEKIDSIISGNDQEFHVIIERLQFLSDTTLVFVNFLIDDTNIKL